MLRPGSVAWSGEEVKPHGSKGGFFGRKKRK